MEFVSGSQPSSGTEFSTRLTREDIVRALGALDEELAARNAIGEICIFGGTVMVLAFNARLSTKDVDAIFQPTTLIRELAKQVADTCNISPNWLNDAVKGYVSTRHEVTSGNLPQFPHLRVTMPTAEYLLAMKCMASRIGTAAGEADDTADIIFLIRHLNLQTAEAVMRIIEAYYPPDRVPVKARFLVESLFEERRI